MDSGWALAFYMTCLTVVIGVMLYVVRINGRLEKSNASLREELHKARAFLHVLIDVVGPDVFRTCQRCGMLIVPDQVAVIRQNEDSVTVAHAMCLPPDETELAT